MSLRPRPAQPPAPPRLAPAPLEVTIDALVLHGLPLDPVRAERVRAALAAELTARLTGENAAALLARPAGGPPPTVHLGANDSPEAIARALSRGLTGPAEGGER